MSGAKKKGKYIPASVVSCFLTDSRKLSHPEQTVFFALKTNIRDGHQFIKPLYEKGVNHFVVSDSFTDTDEFKDACFYVTPSPLKALQNIASSYRKRFSLPVIGITGSNGKTVIKEWMYYLLSKHGAVVRSPKSFNSQIGVPLSVLLIEDYHKYAVFEAGISQPGEMISLQKIIQPDFGIFSNIGPPHSENFFNDQQKIEEKLLLFSHCQRIVMSSSHKQIVDTILLKEINNDNLGFFWGYNDSDHVQIINEFCNGNQKSFSLLYNKESVTFTIPFTDAASSENAMHCFSCMMMMGFDPFETAKYMEGLPSVAMRLELNNGINNSIVINDSYNSDLHSLEIALDFLIQQQQNRTSCVILSDIMQTGMKQEDLYRQTTRLVETKKIQRFIGIGSSITQFKKLFVNIPETYFFQNTQEFIDSLAMHTYSNSIILVKGSRQFGFERIASLFEQKTHQTVLEINLSSILHNLALYRSKLKQGTGLMAMVKAFSYGSGSHEIARLLEYHHVDYLGVAYADEGIELRNKGISMPIMVMAPEETTIEHIISGNLEPEIYSFESLSWLKKYSSESFKIHIKFDSGMHRLGFNPEDISALCQTLKKMPNINVVSVFSHLSSADNPADKSFTLSQIQLFTRMYESFCNYMNIRPKRHILNSAGITAYPEAQFDMVRLGLGLYGIQPSDYEQLPLKQAARLITRIIQIKKLKKGDRIGYGGDFLADRPMTIAIIPIGYADGFRRMLSHGVGKAYINNKACPVAGNICMDMTIIDITGTDAMVGDEVVIFDQTHPIRELAETMKTIPYEVISGISGRVKRIYLME